MKKTIEKILKGKSLTLKEINIFIEKYVEKMTGKLPTAKELHGILSLIKRGMFNLQFAAKQFAIKEDIDIVEVQDLKTGRILKVEIYE